MQRLAQDQRARVCDAVYITKARRLLFLRMTTYGHKTLLQSLIPFRRGRDNPAHCQSEIRRGSTPPLQYDQFHRSAAPRKPCSAISLALSEPSFAVRRIANFTLACSRRVCAVPKHHSTSNGEVRCRSELQSTASDRILQGHKVGDDLLTALCGAAGTAWPLTLTESSHFWHFLSFFFGR